MTSNEPGEKPGINRQLFRSDIEPPFSQTADNAEYFKFRVIQLRRDKGYGRERITRLLREEFGKDQDGKEIFFWSEKTVESWYEDVPKGPASATEAYDSFAHPPSDRPYLMRLDFLKRQMLEQQPLTVTEANTATHLQHFFESPDGETVDLFPQLAVIDAYTHFSAARPLVEALDYLLTLQPWKQAGTAIYYHSIRHGVMKFPYIPMLVETIDTDNHGDLITPYKLGAYAQLGIPAMVYFIRDERSFSVWHANEETDSEGRSRELDEFDTENRAFFAKLCNWRQIAVSFPPFELVDSSSSFTLQKQELGDDDR